MALTHLMGLVWLHALPGPQSEAPDGKGVGEGHISEKWGSLCLCLSCHPLSFRRVSFDHSVASPRYTESVKLWAMIIRREPRG